MEGLVPHDHAEQETLQYASAAVDQQTGWPLGLSGFHAAHNLMHDISNLMAAITMAMGQGPGTPAYILAQTFQPLVNMAVALQLKALNSGPVGTGAEAHAGHDGHVQQTQYHEDGLEGTSRGIVYPPELAMRKRGRPSSTAAAAGGAAQPRADGREPRRRKISSRFTEYVNIDDVQ